MPVPQISRRLFLKSQKSFVKIIPHGTSWCHVPVFL